ncbi:MAG: hypothetical protein H7Z17_04575 [Fuerstia sp.]|nr:hypothetical protein [Fuerstiella sp.]
MINRPQIQKSGGTDGTVDAVKHRESTNSASPESLGPHSMLLRPTDSVLSELTANAEILRFEPTTTAESI